MPIIRPNKGYLRKYSPLTPLPLTPLRVPMSLGGCGVTDNEVGLGFGGALGSGGSFWDSEVSAFGSTDSGLYC